jgi:hypothetical protein
VTIVEERSTQEIFTPERFASVRFALRILLAQDSHLFTELAEFLTLLGCKPFPLSLIDLKLLYPVP